MPKQEHMMTNSNSVIRKNKNSPLTGFLMVLFFITLVLVVVNQIFVNVNARQEQVYSNMISDMRVSALQIANHASTLATGDVSSRFSLSESHTEFAANWTLLNSGRDNLIPTGLGINTRLPGQQMIIQERYSAMMQSWGRIDANIAVIMSGAQPSTPTELSPEKAAAVNAIVADSRVVLEALAGLADYYSAGERVWYAAPIIGYALLLVLLLTIGMYGNLLIRQSREAEQAAAEKNKRNNQAVLKLIGEISSLADGDLTVEATVSEDFTGQIAESINYAVGHLRGLVSAITGVTLDVTTSMESSRQMVESLNDASQRQSESIDSVYVSIRQIGKDINLVSDNAQKSLSVAQNSVLTATGGAEVVKDTIRGMDNIRDQIQDTSKRIKRLGESSQEIGGFVSLINDIAEHTNTLSLNAAIQAASAGDAGRGFAVVADEVHALAERSSDATRQIESLVKVIQRDIKEAVQSMEQTTSEVVAGTGLARRAGAALDDIQKVSRELADLVNNISEASRNQAKSSSELTGSMEVIQKVTSVTSGGITETRDFMIKLGELTEKLKMTVAGFSLNKKDKWSKFRKDNVSSMDQKKPAMENMATTSGSNREDTYQNKIVNA
jgi:methyl-accepting chemotaxis protein